MPAERFSIGLTGGIGSGKSTVADMFGARGAAIIDTDVIAHQLTTPNGLAMPAIRAQFGGDFLTPDGAMDRAKMRAHVFADVGEKLRLEAILHPLIRIETQRAAAEAQGDYLIFVVPLLIESGTWRQRVARILVVDCSPERQVARVKSRSGLADDQIRAIMANQASREARLAAADDVICNDADPSALPAQVDRLHALFQSLSPAAETNIPQHL